MPLTSKYDEGTFIHPRFFHGTDRLCAATAPQNKVVLYSGDVITGEHLLYESPIMKQPLFTMSNEEYASTDVQFFQNNHGFFANLNRIHGQNTERYALRIKVGKLNLFEEIDLSVYGGEELKTEGTNNNQDPMLATGEMYQYYSKGTDAVREAKYSNLKYDLSDNAASMAHLKRYRNYRSLQWGLIGVGAGLIAANVIAHSNTAVKFNPVMALGFVIGGGSYLLEKPKEDELWLAADEYNKETEAVSAVE
ncbi:MAG: hypothetical protein IPP69_04605 [Flavobacteriales bacterium]|nr:hypothetical protein [Flavobacteriales bacterium]